MTRFLLSALVWVATLPSVLRADLVGHWTFDGDALDHSGNDNDALLEGDASYQDDWAPALGFGQSLKLEGTGYALVEHHDSLNLSTALTLTAWIKPLGNVGWDGIIAKNPSDGSAANQAGNFELRLNAGNRRVEFLFQQGGDNDTRGLNAPNAVVEEGRWTHVAVTAETADTGDVLFYVNGELVDEMLGIVEILELPLNESPLYLGNRADLTTTPFNGLLDDVRIYNEVLDESAIADLVAGSASALSASRFSSAAPEGDTIATISKTDPEANETYAFALVSGAGDDDNGKFSIDGDQLKLGSHRFLDDDDGTTYSIRIGTTAQNSGTSQEDIFTLTLSADGDADDLPDNFERRYSEDLTKLSGKGGADADADGLSDLEEFTLINGDYPDLNPLVGDTDGDGLLDGEELAGAGERPPTHPVRFDTDGDGLSDSVEDNSGMFASAVQTGTDPTVPDTDGDGALDGKETIRGTDPTDEHSVPAVALVGLWRFDEEDARDSSGSGHDGELFEVFFSEDTPHELGEGRSAEFFSDGETPPYIEIPHHPNFNLDTAVSITAWIQPIGDVGWDGILAKNPSDGSAVNHAGNYELRVQAGGGRFLQFLTQQGQVNDTATFTGVDTDIESDFWTHVAVTADALTGALTFYIDGTLVDEQAEAIGYGAFPTNTSPLYLGNRADKATTPWDGLLDDIALFDGILDEDQVLEAMQGEFDGFERIPSPPATFSLTAIDTEADNVILVWQSETGATYTVESSPDLETWQALAEGIAATGQSTVYPDTSRISETPHLFYRVIRH